MGEPFVSHKRLYKTIGFLVTLFMAGACAYGDANNGELNKLKPENAATLIAERGDIIWDYVALGDSIPAGGGVRRSYVDYFAEHISEDLGINIRVHHWARNGQTTVMLLEEIRTNQKLRIAISEAEIITIWIGWNDLGLPLVLYRTEMCGGNKNLDCIYEAVASLNSNIDSILDEILSLRSVEDTLIRIADVFNPFVEEWKEQGTFQILKKSCFEDWRDHIVQSASDRKISVVYSYKALNGPSGEGSLTGKGLMLADGLHFNDSGHKLIAYMHREVGYEFTAH